MKLLDEIVLKYGWVVGPWHQPAKQAMPVGFRAVKGWMAINLDDAAEEAVTVRAETLEDLHRLVVAFEAELTRVHEAAKKEQGTA